MLIAKALLAALFAVILWRMYRNHHRQTQAGRTQLLDECIALLQNPSLSRSEAGYAKLEGDFHGYRVRLVLEEDHMTMRKIPSLWLHVVAEARSPIEGSLDILVRPQNTEFYSPSWTWDGRVQPLPEWPIHAIYRTQDAPPDLQMLDTHVRTFFSDEKAKELLLMPVAVRLSYQAKQAERGEYLLLRSTNFDHSPIAQVTTQALLERAIAILHDLEGAPNEH
ncbi:MAG: hypothetical protein K8Q92_01310 [Methylophilales bacterium]|nr:hypothetical protein [Methylophilales bacterium]